MFLNFLQRRSTLVTKGRDAVAHEPRASRHWWRTVLRRNWFPSVALAYRLIALIVGSVVNWDIEFFVYWFVLGVLPGLIALLGWWAWRSAGRV
jgi:hypothetical protein